MERILQSHQLGPHRVDIVEFLDDDGQEFVVVVIDGAVVTDPPLTAVPDADDVMHIYATWQQGEGDPVTDDPH
jgi:hypothetical protein